MRLAEHLGSNPSVEELRYVKQLGVTDVVTGPPVPPVTLPPQYHFLARYIPPEQLEPQVWEFLPLVTLRKRIEDAGLRHAVIEANPPMDRIITGRSGRDEQIENLKKTIRNMGAAGIPILALHFMALGVWRTSWEIPERGGATVNGFDYELVKNAPLTPLGVITEEQMWDNLEYFLKRVMPVAEEARVKIGFHPDDPPISPIAGVARILRSPEAFKRLIELVPSDYLGLEFCQGCFCEMGIDVTEAIRYFGSRRKIFFVHFRNVVGNPAKFHETFHDNGQTDMLKAMIAYREVGFDGPMRPDHYPKVEGDTPWMHRSRAYALGYVRGLMQAAGFPLA
ncbi:MAG: mannonate dehydratase [Candidatus Bathyarchaeia archaeon]